MNIERIMNRYGRTASSVDGCGNKIAEKKCFIQPLRYKNKMYIEGTPTEIGINDSGYYLFLGPPSMEIDKVGNNGYITDGKKKYHIERWENVWFGEEIFFIWAVLEEQKTGNYPCYNHFAERR